MCKATTLEYFNNIKVYAKPQAHENASYAYYIKFRYKLHRGREIVSNFRRLYPGEYQKLRFYVTKTTGSVFIGGEFDKRHMTIDMWKRVAETNSLIMWKRVDI